MIIMKPTKNLVGVTVQGDYNDFYEFVETCHRLTGMWPDEDYSDPYYTCSNRLLGICYDIRHAYQGDREVVVMDNGLNVEIKKYHKIVMPEETVYYSVNILFPELIFMAVTSEPLLKYAKKYYGKLGKKNKEKEELPFSYEYTQYVKDCAIIRNFAGLVWGALGDVIGEASLENLMNAGSLYESFTGYVGQYIEKLDIDLIKASTDKRAGKLKTIAKKIKIQDNSYYQMYGEIRDAAIRCKCSMHEIRDTRQHFPEDFEW